MFEVPPAPEGGFPPLPFIPITPGPSMPFPEPASTLTEGWFDLDLESIPSLREKLAVLGKQLYLTASRKADLRRARVDMAQALQNAEKAMKGVRGRAFVAAKQSADKCNDTTANVLADGNAEVKKLLEGVDALDKEVQLQQIAIEQAQDTFDLLRYQHRTLITLIGDAINERTYS